MSLTEDEINESWDQMVKGTFNPHKIKKCEVCGRVPLLIKDYHSTACPYTGSVLVGLGFRCDCGLQNWIRIDDIKEFGEKECVRMAIKKWEENKR